MPGRRTIALRWMALSIKIRDFRHNGQRQAKRQTGRRVKIRKLTLEIRKKTY